jgi:DNA polymerase-1
MKTLYIIDASGYLYRSYFAIRNITNAKGESTNALFGFLRSIQKLRKDFHPEHLVAVFDGPHNIKKREAIYEDYKAHRKETPPDLIYQIGWAQEACKLLGIPILVVPEVEADDTMASVAIWASSQGAKSYLCTSDKDLCQLVNEQVNILNTFKENQILGPKEVEQNFGVHPKQMVDYLAITGDSSDNVPGLPGFGPKTAAALLQQYNSLDYILNHPEILQGKKQETVVKFADQARLSRQLVTVHTDVDFPKDKTFFSIKPFDIGPLKDFYSAMSFHSLIRELDQIAIPFEEKIDTEQKSEETVSYTLVDNEKAFTDLLNHLASQKEVCIATIATEEQPLKAELIGIGFADSPKQAWYVPVNGQLGLARVIDGLKELLKGKHPNFYGHNVKYDFLVLSNYGVHINPISFDTMLASYLLNSHSRQHSLEHLMLELFGKVKMPLNVLLGKGKSALTLDTVPLESLSGYCCEAVDFIVRIKKLLDPQIHERKLAHVLTDLELPLLSVLSEMERRGIYLDIPYLSTMSAEFSHQLSEMEQVIYQMAGETFNINSPKQLSEILFTKMGIKPPKKTATGLSTNADVLESLSAHYPIAGKIMEYRVAEKLRSTYIDALPHEVFAKTHRIHCTFNQSVAATGRLSCQNPNLQNIPIRTEAGRKIRAAFKPEKAGWNFLAGDYSQIELRLLAHLSDDPALIEAFQTGQDIHTLTAAYIFNVPLDNVTKEQRYGAKAVNFGVIYGQQAFGLSQELGIGVKEASAFIEAYFKRYKHVRDFVEACKEKTRQTGKATTYTGRERLIPEINSKNGILRAAAERLAVNTPLQGTAADLIKMAMLQIDRKLKQQKSQGYMILQVHDELIFELPDEELSIIEPMVRQTMQNVFSLKVPLVVDIIVGKNWAEC